MLFVEGTSFNYVVAAGLGAAYMVVDALYARYTQFVVRKRPTHAATVGALIHLLTAIGVLQYVGNWLYVLPIMLGSWVGIYLGVRYEARST